MRTPFFVFGPLLGLLLFLAPGGLPAAGPLAPASLTDRSGRPFALESLKGQVVLVDFWASWCGPCRRSLPALDALQKKYADKGFKAVGINLDDDADAMDGFLAKVPVGFTVLRDAGGKSAEAFGVLAMPTAFLLDREGRVVARFEGGEHAQAEEEALVKLLAGAALPAKADLRVAASLQATGSLKAWRRGHLADPIMNLDGDRLTQFLRDHVHASKEASAGNGGASGGGCGCN